MCQPNFVNGLVEGNSAWDRGLAS